jgi:hypothetical protein
LAKTIGDDTDKLCKILRSLKRQIVRRAIVAWDKIPETFGDEIVALNDVGEAIRNNCGRSRRPTTLHAPVAGFHLIAGPDRLLQHSDVPLLISPRPVPSFA